MEWVKKITMALLGATTLGLALAGNLAFDDGLDWAGHQKFRGLDWASPTDDDGLDWALPDVR